VKKLSPEEKKKILQVKMAELNKKFKKEVVSFGYDKILQRIPFKSEELNRITGGAVGGRFQVIWGAKGSGKTTMCYDIVANAQQVGKLCMWVDLEHSFDKSWAETQGVNVDDLVIAPRFESAEEVMDCIIQFTKTKAIDLVVIDSIQGLTPTGEKETKKGVERSISEDTIAILARKLSQFFRMSATSVWESDCTILLIGQTRLELGGYITLEKLSGGNALEHWSSLTIHTRRGSKADSPTEKVEGKDVPIGFNIVAKVDKSKVGADEGKTCNIKFLFGKGIVNN
jgi:recombination protein RecA